MTDNQNGKHIYLSIRIEKHHVAVALAILFHLSGAIGIISGNHREWFLSHTQLNLSLMALLLIWCQPAKDNRFFLFATILFLVGMGAETIGANTGRLFGKYAYGEILGYKLNGVPWVIGANWFAVVFSICESLSMLEDFLAERYEQLGKHIDKRLLTVSFLLDAAFSAAAFDFLLEPIAIKLGYWHWEKGTPPVFNYVCWAVLSFVLAFVYKQFRFELRNRFALHLMIIQSLFFISLNNYLT